MPSSIFGQNGTSTLSQKQIYREKPRLRKFWTKWWMNLNFQKKNRKWFLKNLKSNFLKKKKRRFWNLHQSKTEERNKKNRRNGQSLFGENLGKNTWEEHVLLIWTRLVGWLLLISLKDQKLYQSYTKLKIRRKRSNERYEDRKFQQLLI